MWFSIGREEEKRKKEKRCDAGKYIREMEDHHHHHLETKRDTLRTGGVFYFIRVAATTVVMWLPSIQ